MTAIRTTGINARFCLSLEELREEFFACEVLHAATANRGTRGTQAALLHPLEDAIVLPFHPQPRVDLLRGDVARCRRRDGCRGC